MPLGNVLRYRRAQKREGSDPSPPSPPLIYPPLSVGAVCGSPAGDHCSAAVVFLLVYQAHFTGLDKIIIYSSRHHTQGRGHSMEEVRAQCTRRLVAVHHSQISGEHNWREEREFVKLLKLPCSLYRSSNCSRYLACSTSS